MATMTTQRRRPYIAPRNCCLEAQRRPTSLDGRRCVGSYWSRHPRRLAARNGAINTRGCSHRARYPGGGEKMSMPDRWLGNRSCPVAEVKPIPESP